MKYPKIYFKKSAIRDFQTACAFAKDAKYDNGRNVQWAILEKYPKLISLIDTKKRYSVTNKSVLRNFISGIYKVDNDAMENNLKKRQSEWQKIEPKFFALVDQLFNDKQWPYKSYFAYGTIWSMYPRFLDKRLFQIPYKHKNAGYVPIVIAHELLHFMFYDYFLNKFPQYKSDKHQFFVWHISEIFNSVIQNSPTWLAVFKQKSMEYPEHIQIVNKLYKSFHKQKQIKIDKLIDVIIKEVEKNLSK